MRQTSVQDKDFKGQDAKMASWELNWEWRHCAAGPKMYLKPSLSFCDTLTLQVNLLRDVFSC